MQYIGNEFYIFATKAHNGLETFNVLKISTNGTVVMNATWSEKLDTIQACIVYDEAFYVAGTNRSDDHSYRIHILRLETDHDYDELGDILEENLGTDPYDPDTDDDSIPDGWEYRNSLDPLDPLDSALDNDKDGLNNTMEYIYDGDPWNNDTDNDGLSDLQEVQLGTDLRNNDTDSDGIPDKWEADHGLDPTLNDSYEDPDNDMLNNMEEYLTNTDPLDNDTDDDGMPDSWEITYDLDPTNPLDAEEDLDEDNLSNVEEYKHGTDPTSRDSDGDGWFDGEEVVLGTDPLDGSSHPVSAEDIVLFVCMFVVVLYCLGVFFSKRFVGES